MKADKCPICKIKMNTLINNLFYLVIRPEYLGQICMNKKCNGYMIERRHPNQYELLSDKDYKEYEKEVDKE